jgi:hypothetical protein
MKEKETLKPGIRGPGRGVLPGRDKSHLLLPRNIRV